MSYQLIKPRAHERTFTRREPLGGIPGFRAGCSCGEEAWRHDIAQIDAWEHDHQHLTRKGRNQ